MPILVVVVDSIVNREETELFIDTILLDIAVRYEDRLSITWVEGALNPEKKKMLGIKHDNTPALAFFRISDDDSESNVKGGDSCKFL